MVRVAVIGAGLGGIGSIKLCLEEGLEPTCFEMSGNFGGLWRYHESPEEGRASVMKSTVFNSSKEVSGVSDFPPPPDFPIYPDHESVIQYIEAYVERFGLRPYIHTHRKVVRIEPRPSQRWVVTTLSIAQGDSQETTEEFDAVIVSTGHHSIPLYPDFPSFRDKFRGRVLHSHDYRRPVGLENSRVLVVGCGDSGCDIATELSRICPKVYLSVRSGAWVVPRLGPFGIPVDMFYMNRVFNWLFNHLPYSLWAGIVEKIVEFYFNHGDFGMGPPHRIFDQAPTMNESLPSRISCSKVAVKGPVKEYTESGVIFEGEISQTDVDAIIFATGYKMEVPFLPKDIDVFPNNINKCYKFAFLPGYPSLAFAGFFQPIGPGWPVGELQVRWIVSVLAGKYKLPPESKMRAVIEKELEARKQRFGTKPSHVNHCDLINTMDDYAHMLGVKPPFWRLALTDPRLFYHCVFGPCTGYQFRLSGPHACPEARDHILNVSKRMKAAVNSRCSTLPPSTPTIMHALILFVCLYIVVHFWVIFIFPL